MPAKNTITIAGLLLAAGGSSRMGKPKQLLPWQDTTLLGNAIEQLQTVLKDLFVVVGARREEILATVNDHPVLPIHNPEWNKGMGTSIAKGMQHISTTGDFDAVLVFLADQPLLDSAYYEKMIAHFHKGAHPIIATNYGERCGVPAIFDRSFFPALQELNADLGAKSLIKEHKAKVFCLDAEGKELDVDTPERYEQLRKCRG